MKRLSKTIALPATGPVFTDIPEEIIRAIMLPLFDVRFLNELRLVSKAFLRMADSPQLWTSLIEKRFGYLHLPNPDDVPPRKVYALLHQLHFDQWDSRSPYKEAPPMGNDALRDSALVALFERYLIGVHRFFIQQKDIVSRLFNMSLSLIEPDWHEKHRFPEKITQGVILARLFLRAGLETEAAALMDVGFRSTDGMENDHMRRQFKKLILTLILNPDRTKYLAKKQSKLFEKYVKSQHFKLLDMELRACAYVNEALRSACYIEARLSEINQLPADALRLLLLSHLVTLSESYFHRVLDRLPEQEALRVLDSLWNKTPDQITATFFEGDLADWKGLIQSKQVELRKKSLKKPSQGPSNPSA